MQKKITILDRYDELRLNEIKISKEIDFHSKSIKNIKIKKSVNGITFMLSIFSLCFSVLFYYLNFSILNGSLLSLFFLYFYFGATYQIVKNKYKKNNEFELGFPFLMIKSVLLFITMLLSANLGGVYLILFSILILTDFVLFCFYKPIFNKLKKHKIDTDYVLLNSVVLINVFFLFSNTYRLLTKKRIKNKIKEKNKIIKTKSKLEKKRTVINKELNDIKKEALGNIEILEYLNKTNKYMSLREYIIEELKKEQGKKELLTEKIKNLKRNMLYNS